MEFISIENFKKTGGITFSVACPECHEKADSRVMNPRGEISMGDNNEKVRFYPKVCVHCLMPNLTSQDSIDKFKGNTVNYIEDIARECGLYPVRKQIETRILTIDPGILNINPGDYSNVGDLLKIIKGEVTTLIAYLSHGYSYRLLPPIVEVEEGVIKISIKAIVL